MRFKLATWNINSVRLRIDLVARFIRSARPDILCLQETKCPDQAFPLERFRSMGYPHIAIRGQKGYNGVAVLSRLPFEERGFLRFCGKSDCRHLSVVLGRKAGLKDRLIVHNFYVPAGGDEPDPASNPKFAHKLAFLDEMRDRKAIRPGRERAVLVGDLNVAPLESDVWSHRRMVGVVSHTPVECEKLTAALRAGGWVDSMRLLEPEPKKLFTWWSYRALDWRKSDRGRRLDHVWAAPELAGRVARLEISSEYRGAERPSDHVPVIATIEL